jgi:hypothetical protein
LFNVPNGLVGDYNANGTVDAADYALWRDTLGQTGAGLPADGNGDGTVNDADFAVWRANFGLGAPAASAALQSAAVPEPAGVMLSVGAILFLAASARCRTER